MVQDAKPKVVEDRTGATSVPPQALLLSLLSLWVPVLSSSFFPAWTNEDVGILVWLLALVPAFLLSYYRGWRGASLSLAGAMAAFTLAQVVVLLMGSAGPPPDVMVGAIAVLVTVALGSGWISSLFQHSLAEAEEMAFTDPLTGLANRRHALTDLRRAFAAAQRGAGLSVVLFDLDRFKRVNDRFGHGAGDEVLARFGAILRETTREMDLAGRFGGEEFLSVLNGQDVQGAIRYGERVLEKLRGTAFAWGRLTVSAGVATYEPGMASADVLVAAADQALYRAKKAGRDRVAVLGPSGAAVARRRKDAAPIGGVGGSGELVLAVDDDPAVLRVITLALRRNGYRVAQATDPEEAVRIARGLQEPPALVLTDVVMPQMSGFRLVEILSEFLPSVRVVYISGYEADDVEWSGAPGEIRAFLPKPIAVDAMMAAVRDTLDAQPPAGRPDAPVAAEGAAPAGVPAVPPDRGAVVADATAAEAVAAHVTPATTGADAAAHRFEERVAAFAAQLEQAQVEVLVRLARAAECRDDSTGRHAERVGYLAGLLAELVGLDQSSVGRITMAASLHDVGKIGLPDAILNKPDTLTPAEREIMMRHCEAGAELLAGSRNPLLEEAEAIAHHHHERWDGRGYPDGLAGADIPLSARITAVADAYDSLTHLRPSRAALSSDEALVLIQKERNGQFDPTVVDALLALAGDDRLADEAADFVGGLWGISLPPSQG